MFLACFKAAAHFNGYKRKETYNTISTFIIMPRPTAGRDTEKAAVHDLGVQRSARLFSTIVNPRRQSNPVTRPDAARAEAELRLA
jgi:hypothetical protein